jgi:hypothetical protein
MNAARSFVCLLALGALIAAFGAAAPAQAFHSVKPCGVKTIGSHRYRVRAQVISCAFAKKWTLRFVRNGSHPSNFKCTRVSGGKIPFYCRAGYASYFLIKA